MVSKRYNKLYSKYNNSKNSKNHKLSHLNIKKKRKKVHNLGKNFIEKLNDMTSEIYNIDSIKNSNTPQNREKQEKERQDTEASYTSTLNYIEDNINYLQMNK
ncbi:hypothetical protein PMAC_001574 [Pneumocystis sp. 'macacae']|nr:hypothetical protein PMAC_001574 [Pneumocystis sp. 'macacae']